jgi:probable HAF family extracellular repeat protein
VKKSIRLAVVIAPALATLGFGTAFHAAEQESRVTYRVRALESLGGTNSRGNGINDWGLVSGFSNRANATRRATVWVHGHALDLGTLGGNHSSVAWSGLANHSLVVGISQTNTLQTRSDGWSCRAFFPGSDATYVCVGFVWDWGSQKLKPLPTLGGDNGFAANANNLRQVVGWAETSVSDPSCVNPADPGFLPVLWDLRRNTTIALRPFGSDTAGAATAINDRGQVVGISGTCDQSVGRKTARHAVMWENGRVEDLGNLGADTWNTPTAITTRGDIIVGFANTPGADPDDPVFHAWLWTERDDIACTKLPGKNICDLGTLDDAAGTSEAWGVNDRGQVVGTACSPTGDCRAFLWENGEMKDLDLLKRNYPHRLLNAQDINNVGQITGRAQISSTSFEAFIATPTRRD